LRRCGVAALRRCGVAALRRCGVHRMSTQAEIGKRMVAMRAALYGT
jgi:hypothetical protein